MWSFSEWNSLTADVKNLLLPEVVDHLNDLLPESLRNKEMDAESSQFMQIFLSRYIAQDRPLTGYFIVCCVTEIIWTVLAQSLSPPSETDICRGVVPVNKETGAAAANEVWERLMRDSVNNLDSSERDSDTKERLTVISGYAIRCYSDLLEQIEGMDVEPSLDTYAWETMSESLVSSCIARGNNITNDSLLRNSPLFVLLRKKTLMKTCLTGFGTS